MTRSSFEDVLHTNYVPTPSERHNITSLVQMMEVELSSLDQMILPLLGKRDTLNDQILAYKALLTPARRLLPELVGEVFTHSIPSGRDTSYSHDSSTCTFPRPRASETPLKLGRVCRRWRQIALSTPSLWSAIRIPKDWSVEGLQEWISRAASCNLSFDIAVNRRNVNALNLLASHQQRWKEIVLRYDDSDSLFMTEFTGSLSPNYSNLQTLDLGHRNTWDPPGRAGIRLVIESAPNLTHLILRTPIFHIIVPDQPPSLCLRNINIHSNSITTAELLSLLRMCPVVESVCAQLSFNFSLNMSGLHPDILNLGALKHLEISGLYATYQNTCLLDTLCCPALEVLSLTISSDPWSGELPVPNYTPNMKSFLRRSRPPLKILRLTGTAITIPSRELTDSIQLLPYLSCLDLSQVDRGYNEIVELLTGPTPPSDENISGCNCPQLNEIRLCKGNVYPSEPPSLPSDLVIKMILSRSTDGRNALTRVTIPSCSSREVLAHPRILDCIANGLVFIGHDMPENEWGEDSGWGGDAHG
ncbi:hypothetical protein BD410DRAFT_516041 [Rickenella mellea]|uniref:Uncharacterized protein n=1 Tax=Rickenella mellea TaxID=50990 RepID=A0A4Y7PTR2_9AGAM|nr:hypothetical protein BD410DRAFT_516041 [Rickenella mellea]